ncbi:hypothetical protein [Halobacillus sp. Marseille-Q1614]|uniref:hypothetical protein n=1 Tax=Halobacillus sp. Marseille-Q1614 TaxID=2709134 RepID=UPI00157083AF|nr:hypothetical protein [Halobacillus sp. Marseille-Q1614]
MKRIGNLLLVFAVSVFSERLICSIWRSNARKSGTSRPYGAGTVDEIALSGCCDERELSNLDRDNGTAAEAGRYSNFLALRRN